MKTKLHLSLALAAAGLALLAGCATGSGPATPQDTTKYTVENTEKFVLLDQATQEAVSCTGLRERTLPDGRIEVVANVKNRARRLIQIQTNCVFKDAHGFTTGDETPFRNIILPEHATEAVRFTAADAVAKKYTIRVRLTH